MMRIDVIARADFEGDSDLELVAGTHGINRSIACRFHNALAALSKRERGQQRYQEEDPANLYGRPSVAAPLGAQGSCLPLSTGRCRQGCLRSQKGAATEQPCPFSGP